MENIVTALKHADVPVVQTEAMQTLCISVGIEESRDIIERAAFELSDRLWLLEKALHEKELCEVKRISSSIVAISAQIGLTEFSLVANDLAKCVARSDAVATAAVAARLIRVGERSLYMAVQFPEITG